MAQIKLTNLASYRAYSQAIATAHLDIAGFKWGDMKVIQNDSRSDITDSFLWAKPFEGARYIDGYSDNVQKIKQAFLAYMMVPDSEKFSDEDLAFEFAEGVIEQIVAKIILDKRGAEVAGEWSLLITRLASFSTAFIEKTIGGTKYIGCELKLDFQDPANLAYNAEKWAWPAS